MQPCNIATGAACYYTNAAATFSTSKASCSGVGVSQHLANVIPVVELCTPPNIHMFNTTVRASKDIKYKSIQLLPLEVF